MRCDFQGDACVIGFIFDGRLNERGFIAHAAAADRDGGLHTHIGHFRGLDHTGFIVIDQDLGLGQDTPVVFGLHGREQDIDVLVPVESRAHTGVGLKFRKGTSIQRLEILGDGLAT